MQINPTTTTTTFPQLNLRYYQLSIIIYFWPLIGKLDLPIIIVGTLII